MQKSDILKYTDGQGIKRMDIAVELFDTMIGEATIAGVNLLSSRLLERLDERRTQNENNRSHPENTDLVTSQNQNGISGY